MENILESIKKVLGIPVEETHFDQDIILHANSVFSVLTQLGVGPEEGFAIDDQTNWDDYIENDPPKLRLVKTYIIQKVKLYFDPPLNSSGLQAIERQTQELEWRLNTIVDPGEDTNGTE